MDADSLATESFSEAPAATAGVDLTCRVSQVSRRAPMMPSTALAAYGNGARDGPVKRAREVADAWLSSRPRASRAGHHALVTNGSPFEVPLDLDGPEELVAACAKARKRLVGGVASAVRTYVTVTLICRLGRGVQHDSDPCRRGRAG